ncbi:hypothetical protein EVAR_43038_1 [Eumeta japonica]|uniref:Uncharacterized protein n=1 Tax=Eumeta variegata TaxID=151549 RepID=A0A4C1XLY9_EUMVA|nr:hypothetical protein EVAR_43038_1 [Eumeta japonica]
MPAPAPITGPDFGSTIRSHSVSEPIPRYNYAGSGARVTSNAPPPAFPLGPRANSRRAPAARSRLLRCKAEP